MSSVSLRLLYIDLLSALVSQEIITGLQGKGHEIGPMPFYAVVQTIHATDHDVQAACDFRKGGEPDGFWDVSIIVLIELRPKVGQIGLK